MLQFIRLVLPWRRTNDLAIKKIVNIVRIVGMRENEFSTGRDTSISGFFLPDGLFVPLVLI